MNLLFECVLCHSMNFGGVNISQAVLSRALGGFNELIIRVVKYGTK